MKRALSIVAAILALLFAISPQPMPVATTTAAPPDLARPSVDEVTRHTRTAATTQLSVVVQLGDTYGRLATAHCGTFTAWPALQSANGWPERRIPVGATAVIACQPATPATPAAAAPPEKPITIGATWVHPLASGTRGTSCYHTSKRPNHNGVDMPQPTGTAIRAVTAGSIYRKAYQAGGAGYYVVVKHAGSIYTAYMHLRAPSPLPLGANVAAGQSIGSVGATGNATGPHLHFEVHRGRYGDPVNPAPFMRTHAVNLGC